MEKVNIKTRDIKAFRKKIHVWKVTTEDKTRAKLFSEGKCELLSVKKRKKTGKSANRVLKALCNPTQSKRNKQKNRTHAH